MTHQWWPELPELTRWQKWRVRWRTLRLKAFLPWVRVPVSLDTPKTIVFPLFTDPKPEISLIEAVHSQPMFIPEEDSP